MQHQYRRKLVVNVQILTPLFKQVCGILNLLPMHPTQTRHINLPFLDQANLRVLQGECMYIQVHM